MTPAFDDVGRPAPLRKIAGPAGTPPAARPAEHADAPAFRALLERLESQARELSLERDGALRPEELSRAVDRARASLGDALELRDQLLEAYRQARAQRLGEGEPR